MDAATSDSACLNAFVSVLLLFEDGCKSLAKFLPDRLGDVSGKLRNQTLGESQVCSYEPGVIVPAGLRPGKSSPSPAQWTRTNVSKKCMSASLRASSLSVRTLRAWRTPREPPSRCPCSPI